MCTSFIGRQQDFAVYVCRYFSQGNLSITHYYAAYKIFLRIERVCTYEKENSTKKTSIQNAKNVSVKADIARMLLPFNVLAAHKKP